MDGTRDEFSDEQIKKRWFIWGRPTVHMSGECFTEEQANEMRRLFASVLKDMPIPSRRARLRAFLIRVIKRWV